MLQNPHESVSSLFMKYVKNKLVQKLKDDQLPNLIADKYLEIYKELIDQEKYKTDQMSSISMQEK